MTLLPASTNGAYRGAKASVWFLGLVSLGTIIPGVLHYVLPDGGAVSIAGLDVSDRQEMIFALFAWMGATQIAYGLAQLAVAVRYQSLTPLFLLLALLERLFAAAAAWIIKPSASGHHPPEHYAVVLTAPLVLISLILSLRARPSSARVTAP